METRGLVPTGERHKGRKIRERRSIVIGRRGEGDVDKSLATSAKELNCRDRERDREEEERRMTA